jgi:hypothetical protein
VKGRIGSRGRSAVALIAVVIGILAFGAHAASAAPGALDRSFGGGIVSVQPPLEQFSTWFPRQAEAGSGGRVYVLEQTTSCEPGVALPNCTIRTYVSRYLNNGSRDTTYGVGGVAVAFEDSSSFAPAALAVDAGGRAVVARAGRVGLAVTRFDAEGGREGTFGTVGVAPLGCQTCAYDDVHVVIDAKKRITVAAQQGTVSSYPNYGFNELEGTLFARLTQNGRPDGRYGDAGRVFVPQMELGGPVASRRNGAIVAGSSRFLTKVSASGQQVDRDFAAALRVRGVRAYEAISALPGGDIALVGRRGSSTRSFVARLRPSGALVQSFGRMGISPFPKRSILDIAVDAHGRMLLVGTVAEKPFLMRLRPAGTVESRFRNGLGGIAFFEGDPQGFFAGPHPMVIDLGSSGPCRAYCPPHPLLFRFKGGPGKQHRR